MSFFGKSEKAKGWDCFPEQFVKGVRETLGEEKFESLTLLAEKYGLFEQNLFAHPESFTDISDELTNVKIATLLTSMGCSLCDRQIIEDGEKVLLIAITLRPEHYPAHGTLALICYDSGRLLEAREHAQRAITHMDAFEERSKDIPVPQHISDPNMLASFRSLLRSIAEENASH